MLIAVKRNGHGTKADVNTVHHGKRRVHPSQFLDDDRLGDIIDGRASVGFRDGDAVEAVFKERLPFFRRRDLILVAVFNRGGQNGFSEVPHQLSNHLLLVGFAEVHALTNLANMWSLLTRLIRKNYIFFLRLHIPPVEAAN